MKINNIAPNLQDKYPQIVAEKNATNLDILISYLRDRSEEIKSVLIEKGTIVIRGFDVKSPEDFQKVALTIFPNLQAEYPGGAPRKKVTEYVWTASEVASYLPISGHTELSYFPASRPDYILFFCEREAIRGGETPIIDMKAVLADLKLVLPQNFLGNNLITQILMVKKAAVFFDVRTWKLPWFRSAKSWSSTFETEDKNLVEEIYRDKNRQLKWTENEDLIISSSMSPTIRHPLTKELLWSGIFPRFHLWGIAIESWFVAKYRKKMRAFLVFLVLFSLTLIQSILKFLIAKSETRISRLNYNLKIPNWIPGKREVLNLFLEDRGTVSISTVYKIVKSYWKNAKPVALKSGDILILDNYRMGHGRLPNLGDRKMYVIFPS